MQVWPPGAVAVLPEMLKLRMQLLPGSELMRAVPTPREKTSFWPVNWSVLFTFSIGHRVLLVPDVYCHMPTNESAPPPSPEPQPVSPSSAANKAPEIPRVTREVMNLSLVEGQLAPKSRRLYTGQRPKSPLRAYPCFRDGSGNSVASDVESASTAANALSRASSSASLSSTGAVSGGGVVPGAGAGSGRVAKKSSTAWATLRLIPGTAINASREASRIFFKLPKCRSSDRCRVLPMPGMSAIADRSVRRLR